MSSSLEMKKQQVKDYFSYHPDSRVVTVVKDMRTFPALFDNAFELNNRNAGRVQQQKRIPHLTVFSDDIGDLEKNDEVTFSGKTYKIFRVQDDLTDETFQGELWLL